SPESRVSTMPTPITFANGRLAVPDDPIIPFIEGDGTGPDIWGASVRVLDAAVERAYGGKRRIAWKEVYACEKSFKQSNTELPVEVGIGLKPMSRIGTERLVHSAIGYAVRSGRKSVTLVHKGNIMKFTEGAFRDWGYEVAKQFYGAVEMDAGPWCRIPEGRP